MKAGPPAARPLRTLFMKSTPYDAQAVAMYAASGWPAASMPGVFFFQRVCMMRFFLPLGEKVVTAPYGDEPETWISVLAYDSLSYRMIRNLYSAWVNAAEMAPRPMSAPPPSPQKAMTLIGSSVSLPLRMSTFKPAEAPSAAEPAAPSCVCIHGTTHGVV